VCLPGGQLWARLGPFLIGKWPRRQTKRDPCAALTDGPPSRPRSPCPFRGDGQIGCSSSFSHCHKPGYELDTTRVYPEDGLCLALLFCL